MPLGQAGMPSVTELINRVHLSTDSTIGCPIKPRHPGSPLAPSINLSCANEFADTEALSIAHENKYSSVRYARDSSDLIIQLEVYLSALHESTSTCIFQSGMAAIDAALTTCLKHAETILTVGSLYRKSSGLIKLKADECKIEYIHLDSIKDLHELKTSLPDKPLIFLETPSNPFLEIQDIRSLRALLPDSIIIVDITLQGLANDKIKIHNFADIVVCSCTKYASGHNDILAGYAVTKDESLFKDMWEFRSMRGCILDSLSAYLLIRSLRTYDIRIERLISSAKVVLEFLKYNRNIDRIYFPGSCENLRQEKLFRATQFHGGSVITFRASSLVNTRKNISSLLSTKMAPSFGSIDSLIEIPALMSHWGKSKEELQTIGLDEQVIRLSLGLEPLDYILSDLDLLLKDHA